MAAQWFMLLYGLLICWGGGLLAFAGLAGLLGIVGRARTVGLVASAVLVVAGIVVLALRLGDPTSVMAMASGAMRGSPKSLEFVAAVACFVAAIVVLVADQRTESASVARVLGAICLVLGIALGVVGGLSAAVGRTAYTGALCVAYLGNALTMGGATAVALVAGCREDLHEARLPIAVALGCAALQLVGVVWYGAQSGAAENAALFWGLAVVVGCLLPLGCLALVRRASVLAFVGAVGAVACGVALRVLVTEGGTSSLNLLAAAALHAPVA